MFVHDQFTIGRRGFLNIVNDKARECLAAIADTPIPGRQVARTDGADRSPRQVWHDRLGRRHRVHLPCHADLVGG
jgi:hypothetical protein